jgi:Protein of unknown function (DUF1186)/SEC-C motif
MQELTMDTKQVLEELSEWGRLPVEAIRAAQADRAAMAPILLRYIDDFVALEGEPAAPALLFFTFHLLGEWREKSAYRSLANFLRLPRDVLDTVLGDSITETTHRVMAAVFDGDPAPLYEIIRDEEADEFVRSRMCQTIAMLTRRGDLPRPATVNFLRDCHSQLEPQIDCYVWQGWLDAVAWLGLSELKPLVRQAFSRGAIDPTWLSFEDFEKDLQHSVAHPEAEPLHPDGDLTLFGDTVAEMSDWYCFKPNARSNVSPGWNPLDSLRMPHREPLRNVGRNDPCPCGSGKKFKKCCLNRASDHPAADDPPWEPVGSRRRAS